MLSIITVTYNAEKHIERTIRSVLVQSYSDIEYIIIDGKSTDRTVEIAKKFPNFQIISEQDCGLYDAMNKGLRLATGDFVWFVNAGDEIFAPDTAQNIADALAKNPEADIIYGQSLIVDENGKPLGERHKIAPEFLTKNSFLNGLVVCHQSILVRKNIAQEYKLKYRVSADYDWVLNAVSRSKKNIYMDEYLSKFMIAGVSAVNRKKSWQERFLIMKKHFGLCKTLFAHGIIVLKYPFSRKCWINDLKI
ncbi:MAG: glycosyltransferase [Prevotellaceae bacterium]|jgi:glycosyltransferase involved in cell wall biosynthesis|nr:glycosyltransferase [Prevotellaceae bacterium]